MSLDSLLLLGAGPANRLILRSLVNHQRADTRVTLITPHSQALPPAGVSGLVGGSRTLEQSVVDLEPLLKASGARHLSASCSALDADADRPAFAALMVAVSRLPGLVAGVVAADLRNVATRPRASGDLTVGGISVTVSGDAADPEPTARRL